MLLFLASCSKEKLRQEQIILAHAGAGTDYINARNVPNTMSAIRQALGVYKIDGVELDLQFSNDNRGFIYHDRKLEEQTTGDGEICQTHSEDLNDVYWRRSKEDHLMKLEDVLGVLSTTYYPARVSLNIKNYNSGPDYSGIAKYLSNALESYDMLKQAYVESDNQRLLDSIKSHDSRIVCLYNGHINKENYHFIVNKGYDGLVDHHEDADAKYMDSLKAQKKLAVIYGQLSQSDFQSSTTLKADVLQVDNPVLAIKSR